METIWHSFVVIFEWNYTQNASQQVNSTLYVMDT